MPTLEVSGSVAPIETPRLIVATDASVVKKWHSGGFISTDGRWGITASSYGRPETDVCKPQCVLAMELRALWYGLRDLPPGTDLTLLTDSSSAMQHVERWLDGDTALPAWYSVRPRGGSHVEHRPTLAVLQERITADAGHIAVAHVRGHAGHALNEAADTMAGIGMNVLRRFYDREEATRRAVDLGAVFLRAYATQQDV